MSETATATATTGVREGSALKRAAILGAARDLFVAEGFERTSMDAVALRARVSKRTVYDYYGDKRTLLVAVVQDVGQALLDSINMAIRGHLMDDAGIGDLTQLKAALAAFALQVTTSTIGSSDYSAFMKLMTNEVAHLPELSDDRLSGAPEEALAERLAHFARTGLLEAPNPRLAADHFTALTFALVHNTLGTFSTPDPADVKQTIFDGVGAFLRAYAPR